MDKQLCKAGSQSAVTVKNRYQDILPCLIIIFHCCCVETNVVVVTVDVQRVILRLEETESQDSEYVNTQAGADYINACYLDV